ncbi:MAG TPA: MATE family efflux transporter, partial [Clostridia bacterium]|nr:MATE family efflux transporter [Clostridia bacterium]
MLSKLASLTRSQDMTVGTPWRNIVRFSLPLLVGSLVQQLYSTVDAIVVGNYVGHQALASIGASMALINLLLVLFIGVSTGASILSAQYYGARDRAQLSTTIGTTLTLTFLVSVFIMVVGTLITRPLLTLIHTPADVYEGTVSYLTICFLGIIGIAYYNILAGVLRGMGDAFMPLVFLCLACLLNVGLDILFVAKFGWGVAGAAWATIFSQAVSAALCFWRLLRL